MNKTTDAETTTLAGAIAEIEKRNGVGKHTAGPWEVLDGAVLSKDLNDYGNWIVVHVGRELTKQDEANLRLIAAAPEYAEAGQLLRPVIGKFSIAEGRVLVIGQDNKERLMTADESMKFHKGFSKLCTAIVKAEGRAQ